MEETKSETSLKTEAVPAKKRVSFDEETKKESSAATPTTSSTTATTAKPKSPAVKSSKPKKATQFAQGKSHLVRDILILVSVIAFLMYATKDFDPSNEEDVPEDVPDSVITTTLNKMASGLVSFLQEQTGRAHPRTLNCSLFLSPGSIPGTGYSIFAGRDYHTGDQVIHEAQSLLPIFSSTTTAGMTTALPAHAFLLKHHPLLANVEGVLLWRQDADTVADSTDDSRLNRFSLRAIRPIHTGEELFVTYQQHPVHALMEQGHGIIIPFGPIPSKEDYDVADELIDDVILTGRRMKYASRKKTLKVNTDYVFSLLKRSVQKLNPAVAALLPGRQLMAKDRFGVTSSLSQMKNKTLQQHQMLSSCLEDLRVVQQKDGIGRVVQVTRSVDKGEVIVTVPLYVISHGGNDDMVSANCDATAQEQCASPKNPYIPYCLTSTTNSGSSNVTFCPLTEAIYLTRSNGADSKTESGANVEYQWAGDVFRKASVLELLNAPVGAVAWNLVALKNLETGEELRTSAKLTFQ